jgi:hypothetical protein
MMTVIRVNDEAMTLGKTSTAGMKRSRAEEPDSAFIDLSATPLRQYGRAGAQGQTVFGGAPDSLFAGRHCLYMYQ